MELVIFDVVVEKIWNKDNRRISRDNVQHAWELFLSAEYRQSAIDTRHEHDTWPPTEWILVRLNRQVLKLVFIVDDEDEDVAYLKTAFYVDQRTIKPTKQRRRGYLWMTKTKKRKSAPARTG